MIATAGTILPTLPPSLPPLLTMELHHPPMSLLVQGQKLKRVNIKYKHSLYPLLLLLQPLMEGGEAPLQVGLGREGGRESYDEISIRF